MKIQIIDGNLTYYTKGVTLGSTLDTLPVKEHIEALEAYCISQRTPEQILIEQAETEREIAKEKEELARTREIQAYEREREARVNLQEVLKMVRIDELTDEELEIIMSYYPEYEIRDYEVGEVFRYEGKLYKVVQAHTAQEDWKPDGLPALYAPVIADGVTGEWVQPLGVHDAYQMGDQVLHGGKVWESTVNSNVWEPGAYGWEVVSD